MGIAGKSPCFATAAYVGLSALASSSPLRTQNSSALSVVLRCPGWYFLWRAVIDFSFTGSGVADNVLLISILQSRIIWLGFAIHSD
jgi:hypothetical protein